MGGGFRFGVPLFGGLVCSENERLALQLYIGLLGHPQRGSVQAFFSRLTFAHLTR